MLAIFSTDQSKALSVLTLLKNLKERNCANWVDRYSSFATITWTCLNYYASDGPGAASAYVNGKM